MRTDLPVQELRLWLRIDAAPAAVAQALSDESLFAAATGKPARIDPQQGGAFEVLGGRIDGAWTHIGTDSLRLRARFGLPGWPEDAHSEVSIHIAPDGSGTRILVDQRGIPSPHAVACDQLWKDEVFAPIRRLLQPELKAKKAWSARKVKAAA